MARRRPAPGQPGKGLGLSLENWMLLAKPLTWTRKRLKGARTVKSTEAAVNVSRSGGGDDNNADSCPAVMAVVLRLALAGILAI